MTTPPPPPPPPAGAAPKANNGKALASMIVGISSIALCCYWFLSFPGGVVALILGIIARKEIAEGKGTNGGMALAGIITGAVAVLLGIVSVIFAITGGGIDAYCTDNPDSAFCTGQ